jgi:HD-GYP domain-containing protein (c-di-GMP phosphodiesterase class II)
MADQISGIITDFMTALSNCSLYSFAHESVQEHSDRAVHAMQPYFEEDDDLSFTILGDSLLVNDKRYKGHSAHIVSFMKRLRRNGIEKIVFEKELKPKELAAFIATVASTTTEPKSMPNITIGMMEVRFSNTQGGDVSAIIDEDIEKLREIDEELTKFGNLNMIGLEDVVASFITTMKEEANVLRVISPVKSFSNYTFTHTTNVTVLSIFQAESLGMKGDILHEIGLAGLLHDVGKMFVPKEILDKPGKLTDEEWVHMRNHAVYGAKYLSGFDDVPKLGVIVAYEHHMKFNGTGYPDSIRRDRRQHIISQIIAVSDFFEALRAERPYRKGLDTKVIIGFMEEGMGTDFNPVLVKNFIRVLHEVNAF